MPNINDKARGADINQTNETDEIVFVSEKKMKGKRKIKTSDTRSNETRSSDSTDSTDRSPSVRPKKKKKHTSLREIVSKAVQKELQRKENTEFRNKSHEINENSDCDDVLVLKTEGEIIEID